MALLPFGAVADGSWTHIMSGRTIVIVRLCLREKVRLFKDGTYVADVASE